MALALAVAHELLNFLKWWMWYVVMADDSIGDLYTVISVTCGHNMAYVFGWSAI